MSFTFAPNEIRLFAAFAAPPQSTEQILHPERYPDDKPIAVVLPEFSDVLGQGWEEYDRGVMGEWYIYLILALGRDENAQQPTDESAAAAEGWGGDSYVVFYNPKEQATVMAISILWESNRDANEFAAVFSAYARDRFGHPTDPLQGMLVWMDGQDVHSFHIDGAQTTWILAPNIELAEATIG